MSNKGKKKVSLVVKLHRMVWQNKADLSEFTPYFDTIYVRITDFKSLDVSKMNEFYGNSNVPDFVNEAIMQVRKWFRYHNPDKKVILTSFQYDLCLKMPQKRKKGVELIEFGEKQIWY